MSNKNNHSKKQKNEEALAKAETEKSSKPAEESKEPETVITGRSSTEDPKMDQKNPKEEEVKTPKTDKEGFFKRIWSRIKAAPGATWDGIKAVGMSIKNTAVTLWEKLKHFFSKEGMAEAAGSLRPILAILTLGLIVGTIGYQAVVAYGATKVIVGLATATVVTYGVSKVGVEDKTSFSLGEAFGIAS